jgi:tetratricopeptide (TPR) repeat protein
MVRATDAFDLARSDNHEAAANVLKQEFLKLQSSDQKVELCEWIANCFENLQDYGQAAEWYEMAGALSLTEMGSPLINAMMALREYERALECHERGEDEESAEACLRVISDLRHVYSAS